MTKQPYINHTSEVDAWLEANGEEAMGWLKADELLENFDFSKGLPGVVYLNKNDESTLQVFPMVEVLEAGIKIMLGCADDDHEISQYVEDWLEDNGIMPIAINYDEIFVRDTVTQSWEEGCNELWDYAEKAWKSMA